MTNEPTNRDLQGSISELRTELHQSIQEVLQTMNSFAQSTENRFQGIENELVDIRNTMATKEDLSKLTVRMVTKEYLDEKLYDLRGDLIQMTRKQIAQKFARD